ncbi:unnamed protein product [Prunus armeniaca]|uniref:Uncharacterized protein n=1 Tax=Prunus armeniaca TaxID=36596 RepID=A0A6J5U7G9_PRUAR|nr:unnamed protein product [Prunus armeniaca]CAB4302778.1 unnamed protein product [Prunus armeniaca]
MPVTKNSGKYLGVPLIHERRKCKGLESKIVEYGGTGIFKASRKKGRALRIWLKQRIRSKPILSQLIRSPPARKEIFNQPSKEPIPLPQSSPGRKRVETESQDSHPGIGYRQADQRSKESKPRRKGKAEKTVFNRTGYEPKSG